MKAFTENTTCPTLSKAIVSCAFIVLFSFPSLGQSSRRFTPLDRTIIQGVMTQFRKECGFVSTLNDAKLIEIQNSFRENSKIFTKEQNECFDQYLGQIVGAQNIYKNICDEITPLNKTYADSELSRIFVNVRKFEGGIRPFHEKLNDCLVRKGVETALIVGYVDFEMNSRTLSKKIREVNTQPPFRENRVDFR